MTGPATPGDGDHARPWLRTYPAGVPSTYPYPRVHAARLLDDAAQDFPDTIAVEYRRYGLSYRKLADHADRLATALGALGVGPGADVALLLPNCPQLIIALFAAWRVGGRVHLLSPESAAAALAATDPSAVVMLDRWYDRLVAAHRPVLGPRTSAIVTGIGDYLPFPDNVLAPVRRALRGRPPRLRRSEGVLGFADLLRRSVPEPEEPPAAEGLVALVTPQGDITQRHLVVNSFQLRLWLPDVLASDERVLLGVPLSSSLGAVWVLTSVLAAATMILVDDRRTAVRQRMALRARPTLLAVDDELAEHLVRSSRRRARMSSVRITVTRDPLAADRRHALEELTDKGRVRRAWGVRDLLTHADPIYGRYEEGTVGLPLPDTAVVVAEPSDPGRPVALGRRGRLWVRGPQLQGDTWIDAGVDATLHANGYLTVHEGG